MSTSNFGTPIIDSFATARKLAPVIMNNVVQELQLKHGVGITEKFSQDVYTDEIRIIRQVALTQDARTLGESIDGKHFSTQTIEQPVSAHYGMRIRHIYNTPIDIPQSMMDMIPLDMLNNTSRLLHQAISKNVNASTLAEMLATELNYEYNSGTPLGDRSVEVTLGTTDILDAIFDMSEILDDGDSANGQDTFDAFTRSLQLRPSVVTELKKSSGAVFDISNWKAQDMLQVGALDPVHRPNNKVDGYQGEINGTQVFKTTGAIWTLAEKYLGLTAADLDDVYGLMSASEGTGRALAFTNSVVTGQSPLGQGVRLYPLYRWGHDNWFKSCVLLLKTDFVSLGTGSLSVIATGSRA
ncbi:MAG: hypothetical protein GQ557_01460 [Mycoplasmataceae bacterium]|nr:hypothetical protein [Mycoplasmataceae bacterium]